MTNKEKQLKKQRIKGYLLKTLHVICYVLSIAFIGLMVFTGVQSCSKRDTSHINNEVVKHSLVKRSAIQQQSEYILTPLYSENDSITIDLTKQAEILASFGKEPNTIEGSRQQIIINLDDNGYFYTGSTFYSGHLACYIGTMQPDDSTNWYWRFEALAIDKSDTWYYGIYKETQMANAYADYTANNIDLVRYYVTSDIIEQYAWLSYFFEIIQPTQFEFNKQFNFNAPLQMTLNDFYGPLILNDDGHNRSVIDTGYFKSNGQLFDKIGALFMPANAMHFDFNNNGNWKLGASDNKSYVALQYRVADTENWVYVNFRDTCDIIIDNAYSKGQLQSSTWVNDSYRYLTFLQPLSSDNSIRLNAYNNNNQNAYQSNDNNFNNVFTLVGSAFTGLLPILSMQILPYVTIGTLLFIPIVAMLVFAIIRIIKK